MAKNTDASAPEHVSGQSNSPLSKPAHALSWEDVLKELGTDAMNGLDSAEAESREKKFGPNELEGAEGVQPLKIIIAQIANAMTLVSHKEGNTCPSLGREVNWSSQGPYPCHGRQFWHQIMD
jgi:P-type Na+/K+ transporter